MGTKFEATKGRAKEAVGDAIDDQGLERAGKLDQAGATIKERVAKVVDEMKEKLDDVLSMGRDGPGG